jgi:uncharacterized ferredoxin-like protein
MVRSYGAERRSQAKKLRRRAFATAAASPLPHLNFHDESEQHDCLKRVLERKRTKAEEMAEKKGGNTLGRAARFAVQKSAATLLEFVDSKGSAGLELPSLKQETEDFDWEAERRDDNWFTLSFFLRCFFLFHSLHFPVFWPFLCPSRCFPPLFSDPSFSLPVFQC